ncbi:hypothetical protein FA15DRAFT_687009 [Coprinopsis marcescibilis]|uniref:AB hydrolase-1 domain-containing protein n=1 Tax=Coprinopsis marcescibilis TaxID=230819 RepID=A0A5C3KY83_COPMA|nr:hypothetical protein FA15DRAFT_687009 [Coprinopsis marcescibilis]
MTFQTLVVNNAGARLAYLDSGPPLSHRINYKTLFAVHGIVFSAPIFQRVMDLATQSGLRIVAINRSDYPGSSPLSAEDIGLISRSDAERVSYFRKGGLELVHFIDMFIRVNKLPEISEDGETGGVALLGWSLGNSFTLSGITHASELADDAKDRLSKHLRSVAPVINPPSIGLGMPLPARNWLPYMEDSIPFKDRIPLTTQWLTNYIDHSDISKRDDIYNMHSHIPYIAFPDALAGSDGLLMKNLSSQLSANYHKACYRKEIRSLFPHMKVWEVTGDMTGSFAVVCYWQIQDDDDAHGGENFNVQWDKPERTIEAYLLAVA